MLAAVTRHYRDDAGGPAVPVGGGVPVDPLTGERFGYLPRKAARRKIIIRRTLGLPWVLGALGAALVIAVAGAAFLLSDPGRPPARYADEGSLAAYPPGQVTVLRSGAGWVDRRSGVVVWLTRAAFCDSDGGWADGTRRWDAKGRTTASDANLPQADTQVADGKVYVDSTRTVRFPGLADQLGPCTSPRAASP